MDADRSSLGPLEDVSLGFRNHAIEELVALDPEYVEKMAVLYDKGTFGRDGALPRVTKEIAMVGICCATRQPRGIRLHAERALTLGATPREVLEIMEVAAIPAGMPGLWMGVDVLRELLAARGIDIEGSPTVAGDGADH